MPSSPCFVVTSAPPSAVAAHVAASLPVHSVAADTQVGNATDILTAERIARLHPILLRVAQRMVGRRGSAEDIAQDTWLSAMRSIHAYQGRSSLLTWLVAIMRHRISDGRRRAGPAMEALHETDWLVQAGVVEELELREDLAHMRLLMEERLSNTERAALQLCDVQEIDRDEAAAQLNVSRGHLRVLLHRARAEMRVGLRMAAAHH